ncbi:MAG: peptide deformylase [Streptococcaceae bacterium]|jgi:peptide deformylase|nr:peptide deformylase [Streptococcaceae bacterium]
MDALEKIIQDHYVITMKDIIFEGHKILRLVAEEVENPITPELLTLGEQMMTFLKNSQDPKMAEELELRGGVGLAAPQLNISKRILAILIPDEEGNVQFEEIMYNPKIIAHSAQEVCLKSGEGCLSVEREVPGFVSRYKRVTVMYINHDNKEKTIKLKDHQAIVLQHELDHLNGVLFFDRINEKDPWEIKEGMEILD